MAGIDKKEYDLIENPVDRFLVKVYDKKQFMGMWYSLFAKRILPFMLFLIPVNVIAGRALIYTSRIFPEVTPNGTMLLLSWIIIMLVFLAISILAPKAATVAEFMLGIVYLVLAFHYHLYNTVLGYFVLFSVILFLLVKFVFLIFEIIRIITFAKDEEGIERDESGRILRNTEEEVFFTEEEKSEDDENAVAADEKIVFTENDETEDYGYGSASGDKVVYSEQDETEDYEYETVSEENVMYTEETDDYETAAAISDDVVFSDEEDEVEREVISADDVVFIDEDMNEGNEPVAAVNEEIFFVSDDEEITGEGRISESDNDYFFG